MIKATITINLGALLHEQYNAWRAEQGLTPIQLHTLRRYFAGGQGYESGPPKKLVEFLKTAFAE